MCAGDFVEVYSKQPGEHDQIIWVELRSRSQRAPFAGEWDAVLTCFFIDTAQNIVSYIETIAILLREGGVWINLGPLLYHFEVR